MKEEKIEIYFAAALFNLRETLQNAFLVSELEKKYKVNFPQRDGFEFSQLGKALKKYITEKEIPSAIQDIIYYYDMGKLLPKSKIVVANFDEPQDEGVIVEATHAKLSGIPVIGFRTDVRSPYGNLEDNLRGMHFFPAYQCDIFIPVFTPSKTRKQGEENIKDLANKIDSATTLCKPNFNPNPVYKKTIDYANTLFNNIQDIHTNLEEIAKRYSKNKNKPNTPLILK